MIAQVTCEQIISAWLGDQLTYNLRVLVTLQLNYTVVHCSAFVLNLYERIMNMRSTAILTLYFT